MCCLRTAVCDPRAGGRAGCGLRCGLRSAAERWLCASEKEAEKDPRDGMGGGAPQLLVAKGSEGTCTGTNKMATLVASEQFRDLKAKSGNTTGASGEGTMAFVAFFLSVWGQMMRRMVL